MTMFSDYDLSALGDHAASGYFSSDQYYQGFNPYLKELNKTLERNLNPQKEENKLGDALASAIADGQKEAESKQEEKAEETAEETDAKPKEPKGPEDYIIPALVCGLILTILYMASLKSGMKTANMQKDAQGYQRRRCCVSDTQERYLSYQQHHEEADRAKAGQQTELWQS